MLATNTRAEQILATAITTAARGTKSFFYKDNADAEIISILIDLNEARVALEGKPSKTLGEFFEMGALLAAARKLDSFDAYNRPRYAAEQLNAYVR